MYIPLRSKLLKQHESEKGECRNYISCVIQETVLFVGAKLACASTSFTTIVHVFRVNLVLQAYKFVYFSMDIPFFCLHNFLLKLEIIVCVDVMKLLSELSFV